VFDETSTVRQLLDYESRTQEQMGDVILKTPYSFPVPGFEYRHGMDYEKICRMTTCDGDPLLIYAGVCVTDTLPYGSPEDVKKEMQWLVENGPRHSTILQCSSSITPGVPWENLKTLVEGFNYYRSHGQSGATSC
jgi:hypothetical protein